MKLTTTRNLLTAGLVLIIATGTSVFAGAASTRVRIVKPCRRWRRMARKRDQPAQIDHIGRPGRAGGRHRDHTTGYPIGIDVSGHDWENGKTINWSTEAANGVKFTYIKATEVVSAGLYVNPHFGSDYNTAKSVGIFAGAYAFGRPDLGNPVGQADQFLSNMQWANDGRTLPPMLDMEWPYLSGTPTCYGLSQSGMVSWISSFVGEVQAHIGRAPTIYTNVNWWNPCTGNSAAFAGKVLDITPATQNRSRYPDRGTNWTFWQYDIPDCQTGATRDWDVFNGTLDGLARLAGSSAAPGEDAVAPLSGDFNGDGRADEVMAYHAADNSIGFYTSTADSSGHLGSFTVGYTVPASAGWDWNALRFVPGDFNGDGRADLAMAYHATDNSIGFYTALADSSGHLGSFTVGYTVPPSAGWDWSALRFVPGDFNGDGRADLAMAYHRSDNSIGFYTSTADSSGHLGSFAVGYTVPASAGWDWNALRFVPGDFNGDGRADLAMAYHATDNSIGFYTSTADSSGHLGSFTVGYTVPASAGWDWNALRFVPGDFNGDGRADLAMAYHATDNSIGFYTARPPTAVATSARSLWATRCRLRRAGTGTRSGWWVGTSTVTAVTTR